MSPPISFSCRHSGIAKMLQYPRQFQKSSHAFLQTVIDPQPRNGAWESYCLDVFLPSHVHQEHFFLLFTPLLNRITRAPDSLSTTRLSPTFDRIFIYHREEVTIAPYHPQCSKQLYTHVALQAPSPDLIGALARCGFLVISFRPLPSSHLRRPRLLHRPLQRPA